jgi:hypothetical protein
MYFSAPKPLCGSPHFFALAMTSLNHLSDAELAGRYRRARELLADAPLAAQQAAISLWDSGPFASARPTSVARVLNRIAAALSFDSWATPALHHGMRGAQVAARHLLYSARGRDIDLRISPKAEAFSLAGQLLGPDATAGAELTAQLLAASGASVAHVARLNPLGEFRIDGVREGSYRLTLRTGEDEIVLPPIDVGEPRH